MPEVVARALVVVVSVLVLGWLVVLLRDAHLAAAGSDRATGRSAAAHAGLPAAIDGLRRARLLNPDSQLDVYRARLQLSRSDARGSLRTAEAVVRREPDNIDGWVSVWAAAVGMRDRRRASEALDQIGRLNPRAPLPR